MRLMETNFKWETSGGSLTISQQNKKRNHRRRRRIVYPILRRAQDIFFSLLALIVLSPLLLVVSVIIFVDDPHGSPIFVQKRVGKDGKLFRLYKFRSMVVNAEAQLDALLKHNEMDGPAFKMKNDPRLTKVGRFIRKTSIDELPQLVNILKGEMSIVGPRPALPREVEKYNAYQMQRISVRPGLTCYWQVQKNRNQLSFDDWMRMDLQYIEDRNFFLDWKLIIQTVFVSFSGQGE
jgi:lipopolysaccharide/colanic/teichoic acid biosynthesis glycosyltransferase